MAPSLSDLIREALNSDNNDKESTAMTTKTYYKFDLTIKRYIEIAPNYNAGSEPGLRTVDITDQKFRVKFIKLIRAITNLGLKESKDICDFYTGHAHGPFPISQFVFSPNEEHIIVSFVITDKRATATLADIMQFILNENQRDTLRNVNVNVYNPIALPMID